MSVYSSVVIYISLFLGLYYQIFLLITFFEKSADKHGLGLANVNSPELPTVSIIVPCFNEEKTVEKTVLSLLKLNYPKEKLNIVVIDDGSTDSTYSTAQKLTKFENVKVFTQKNGGKYTALNFGIKNANTDVVGCLDADSTVHEDSLLKMIPYFNIRDVVAVTPAMKACKPKTFFQRMQNTEYNIGIFVKRVMGQLDAIHVTPGPFSLFKKDIFEKIGYFRHAHNTEDMEIAFRIQDHRYRIANCPTAFVYTITPPTFRKLYKQRIRWTYGFLKNAYDYRHMFMRSKYGHMGMLTLPFAVFSVVVVLLIFANTVYHVLSYVVEHIQRYLVAGFEFKMINFDLFYLNTHSIVLLTIAMFCGTLTIMALAWQMTEGKIRIGRDIIYFVAFYGFLAPIWLIKASYNAILSKGPSWR
jgi:cellulose synthase/poly-beta-1,6-N-acetylglucosamine synthase-like glycosyltransferase